MATPSILLLVCVSIAMGTVSSSPSSSDCVGISHKFRLYVHLNMINRLFKSRLQNEPLLPRPIVRGRGNEVQMKEREVKALLSLLDHNRESMTGNGNDALLEVLHTLLNHTDETTCKYLKESFEVDCDEAGETRRVLQILKVKESIEDLLEILSRTESRHRINPSCACIQQLIPDNTLRRHAIANIGILGCA